MADVSADKQALLALRKLRARVEQLERARTEPIAVIGLACRFPGGANTPDAFWQLLDDEVDAVRDVPADRWDVEAYYDPDPDAPGKMYTRSGGFVDDIDRFDAEFFRIAPREAVSMDPQQRLLLEVGWEALEDAGCAPEGLAGTDTGVFVGIGTSDYSHMLLDAAGDAGVDTYFGTGNALSAAAGRLAYVLGLHGPAMSIDTACSSSLVAVHLACQSLRARECDIALAGGVNAILSPSVTLNFCRARMLSADGRCKTFDAAASGYVRGEGCGVIILKRLSDALADKDRIRAVIRGSAVNQDGRSGGFTAPSELAQAALIRKALAAAGTQPDQISYIEAHGTGTTLGDPIEAHALAAAFAGRPADHPLVVGSVKTNIGHLEAAAGLASIIKVVLALQHRRIPRHLHFTTLNPHIELDGFPLEVAARARDWSPAAGPRIAGVSSFGFSGTNAHIVIEEPPLPQDAPAGPERPIHVLALSARTGAALQGLVDRHGAALAGGTSDLAHVCYTANAGRTHFDERLAVVADSAAEMQAALAEFAATGRSDRAVRGTRTADPEIAFLFTGQGAQYAGMGRALYDSQPAFRSALEACDALLRDQIERPLLSVLYPPPGEVSPIDEAAYTQVTLFAVEYAMSELWRSWGVQPSAALGHSVGEYAAACVAGVFSLEDALRLVASRGRLMASLPAGGAMAGVRTDDAGVSAVLRAAAGRVAIAASNGPTNTVLSGDEAAVDAVLADLARAGIAGQRLNVPRAFHSPFVDPMLDAFEAEAARVTPSQARLVMASNLTGGIVPSDFVWDAAYWRRQTRERVRFAEGLTALYERGVRVFLEVGPQPTLINLARTIVPAAGTLWLPSLRRGGDAWQTVAESLAQLYARGVAVDWTGFDRGSHRRKVAVPTYPFQRERFWIDPAPRRPAPSQARPTADVSGSLLYDVQWIQPPDAEQRGDARPDGRWILVADQGGVARLVHASLLGRGFACDLVSDIAAVAGPADDSGPPAATRVLDFRALDVRDAAQLPAALSALAALVTRLAPLAGSRLWAITSGAQPAGDSLTPIAVEQAPVWGFARVAALEHPDIWGGLVDLDPDMPIADQIPGIVADLAALDGEDQVAYRRGRRLVARLRPTAPLSSGSVRLSPDATYLITGGMGSLGLHVARRFVERGARHLVLLARSAFLPRTRWPDIDGSHAQWAAIEQVRQLEALGAAVTIARGDVSSPDDIARVMAGIGDSGRPLRGVVHAAGTVQQFPLAASTPTALEAVMRAKTIGTLVLQDATAHAPLDFFLLFSSVSAVWGSKGLSAYAAANHFLDAVAHDRRRRGYPALSINWGPWADGGMTSAESRERLGQLGLLPVSPEEGVDALEALMTSPVRQALVARVDWSRFLAVYTAAARRPLLEDLAPSPGRVATPAPAPGAGRDDRAAVAAIMAAAPEARSGLARDLVLRQVASVLRLPQITATRPLTDLGIDSLMAIELRNEIQRSLGVVVPMVTFLDGSTANQLADAISASLAQAAVATDASGPDSATSVAAAGPTGAEAEALLERIHELSEAEVDALLSALGGANQPH